MPTGPTIVLSSEKNQCLTFFWADKPEFYVGYRIIEHRPEMADAPLGAIDEQPACKVEPFPPKSQGLLAPQSADPWQKGWASSYAEQNAQDKVGLSFSSFADGCAWAQGLDNDGRQQREFFFRPAHNGVQMWMRMTARVGVLGACAVQQCLRFSGATNQQWRQKVAHTPVLSEFDVQAQGKPNDSLTWVRRDGTWSNLPVQHTLYHTPQGRDLAAGRSDGQCQHGLIVRESLDRQLSSGMYWQRTAYVSNRHPADCLHSSVDFGPLRRDESRTVQGKFYLVAGTKDKLLEMWREEFPVGNSDI